MDKRQKAANVIVSINRYRDQEIKDHELIQAVCTYFDTIKNEELSQSDLKFLKYISSQVGVPHYFDLLEKFKKNVTIDDIDLKTFSSLLYESTLYTSEDTKLHKFQKEILERFKMGALNRYILSASTSFGKTHIAYEIIKKMDYKNVVLIFPTIALLSENLEKILTDYRYQYFKSNYIIHTLSEVKAEELGQKNIFIYTPERFLSFIEKQQNAFNMDFAFIDEVYKIDNDYIIDEQAKENERDVSYRIAAFYTLLKDKTDVLLAGPYIESYNASFLRFLNDNKFERIDYNHIEIVNKHYETVSSKISASLDGKLNLDLKKACNKKGKLKEIINNIAEIKENCIVYCSSKRRTEDFAKEILHLNLLSISSPEYTFFLDHLETEYGAEWVILKALKQGIGIHHGLVPKYIQKEIIDLFNTGTINVLFSTTTITEGVNTSAKNMVAMDSKKGRKELKRFDAKNIAGRAGRFLQHYSGRVIPLEKGFEKALNQKQVEIRHKNYDINSPKDEVDLFYSKDEFLNKEDIDRKKMVRLEQEKRNIPDFIFNQYKVVSRLDKIKVYDSIKALSSSQKSKITDLISRINYPKPNIDWEGFEIILAIVNSIITNKKLKFLIERKSKQGTSNYSVLTVMVYSYLTSGFKGSYEFKKRSQSMTTDDAIREAAEFTYNILKYHLVKYLGVFNIMYKFYISQEQNKKLDEITGIDKLLTKLEYNALTDEGRKASDYGVPQKVLNYYEDRDNAKSISKEFDPYEKIVFSRIEKILSNSNG